MTNVRQWRAYRRPTQSERARLVPLRLPSGKIVWVKPLPPPDITERDEFTELDAIFALDLLDGDADLDFGF